MHRIDTATVAEDLFGSGKDGFTNGNVGMGVPPTNFDDDWCNALQEELATFIESRGITLVKGTNTQLASAILSLFSAANVSFNPLDLTFGAPANATAALTDRVKTTLLDPATGLRTLLWRMPFAGSETRQLRVYATSDNGNSDGPSLEFTINARWNLGDTKWYEDDTDEYACRLSVAGRQLRMSFQQDTSSAWLDSAWVKSWSVDSDGDINMPSGLISYPSSTVQRVVAIPMDRWNHAKQAFTDPDVWLYESYSDAFPTIWSYKAGDASYKPLACSIGSDLVPHDGIVTKVELHANIATSTPTAGQRPLLTVVGVTHGAFGSGLPTKTVLGFANLDVSSGHGKITVNLSPTYAHDSLKELQLYLFPSSSPSYECVLYGGRITYWDPGPRNH